MGSYDGKLRYYEHHSFEVLTACGWPSGGRNATMVLGNLIYEAWEGGWMPTESFDLGVKLTEPLDDEKGTAFLRLDNAPEEVKKTVTCTINRLDRYGLWLHLYLHIGLETMGICRLGGDRTKVGVKRGSMRTTINSHRAGDSVYILKMADLPGEQGINGTMDREQFDFLVERLTPMRNFELDKDRERVERNKQRAQAEKKAERHEQAKGAEDGLHVAAKEREQAIRTAMKHYPGPFNRRGYPRLKALRKHSGISDLTNKEKKRIWDTAPKTI